MYLPPRHGRDGGPVRARTPVLISSRISENQKLWGRKPKLYYRSGSKISLDSVPDSPICGLALPPNANSCTEAHSTVHPQS